MLYKTWLSECLNCWLAGLGGCTAGRAAPEGRHSLAILGSHSTHLVHCLLQVIVGKLDLRDQFPGQVFQLWKCVEASLAGEGLSHH